jgi:hypothetical protein
MRDNRMAAKRINPYQMQPHHQTQQQMNYNAMQLSDCNPLQLSPHQPQQTPPIALSPGN